MIAIGRNGITQVGHLVVSPCVLTELDYLVATRQGPPTAGTILRYVASRVAAGRWEVPGIGRSCLPLTRFWGTIRSSDWPAR